jgi:hypothetical protein
VPDSSTSVKLVVTTTQTITNDAYRPTADSNLSAVGEVPAVTYVGQPVPSTLPRLDAGVGSSRERSETGLPCARKRRYTTAEAVVYLHGDHPSLRSPASAPQVQAGQVWLDLLNNRRNRQPRGAIALPALRPGALDHRHLDHDFTFIPL